MTRRKRKNVLGNIQVGVVELAVATVIYQMADEYKALVNKETRTEADAIAFILASNGLLRILKKTLAAYSSIKEGKHG